MKNPLAKLFAPRLKDMSESRRLAITLNERPFREMFNAEHMEDVRRARQWCDRTIELELWPTPREILHKNTPQKNHE